MADLRIAETVGQYQTIKQYGSEFDPNKIIWKSKDEGTYGESEGHLILSRRKFIEYLVNRNIKEIIQNLENGNAMMAMGHNVISQCIFVPFLILDSLIKIMKKF